MPASKRKSSNPRAAQATLAFGARSNKITKPIAPSPPSSKKLSKPQTEELVKAAEEGIPPAEVSVPEDASLAEGREEAAQRLAIRQAQTQEVRSEAEEKASKISEAAVKKYWRQKEEERKAPRVHQQSLTLHEKILRHFDLSSQYGPCIGMPRTKRWKRAETLGLKPPIEVLAVLMKEEKRQEKPYMEELLSGGGSLGP